MIFKLAFRSLAVQRLRTLVLAAGFGLGIAVGCMIAHVILHTRSKNIIHDLEGTMERVFNLLTITNKSGGN